MGINEMNVKETKPEIWLDDRFVDTMAETNQLPICFRGSYREPYMHFRMVGKPVGYITAPIMLFRYCFGIRLEGTDGTARVWHSFRL